MQVEEKPDLILQWSDRDPSDARIRQVLLEKVRRYWIEGVLEPSLADRPYIPLAIDADNPPLLRHEIPRVLPIAEGETTIVLGDRGSGKTTLLLEIARTALDRAASDRDRPIPVVLPLSAWNGTHETIADWLVDELQRQYQIAADVSQGWMLEESDRFPLMLLLDGLERANPSARAGFIDALNRFSSDRPQAAIALTCALPEFKPLASHLKSHRNLTLNALSCQQIDRYLAETGSSAITAVVQDNPRHYNAFNTPLTLTAIASIPGDRLPENPLDSYLTHYCDRLGDDTYSTENARRWLSWLGCSLCDRSQTLFFIEELHRDWLPAGWQQQLYSLGIWAIAGVMTGPIVGLSSGLLGGLVMGWLRGPVGILAFRWLRLPVAFLWLRVWVSRAVAPLLQLSRPLLLGMVKVLPRSLSSIVTIAMRRKLTRSLLRFPFKFISKKIFRQFTPQLIRRSLSNGVFGWDDGITRFGIPNQQIWDSAKKAKFFAIVAGLSVGTIAHLLDLSFFQGAIAGLLLGFFAAGRLCIQHLWVRLLLSFMGCIPWNYAAFLDWAVNCGFLYKVGGGYLFVHPQLQDRFAQLNSDKLQ